MLGSTDPEITRLNERVTYPMRIAVSLVKA